VNYHQEQRLIIETFRSGVPSRRVASRFPMGREKYLETALHQIKALRPDGTQCSLISANYGEGKTHLLHAVWDLALREECVVSLAILSRETPFDKLHKVYPKVIAGSYLPGSGQPGIEQLVSGIRSGSREADEIIGFAEKHLHPKLGLVLRNYIEGSSTDSLYALYQDLAGEFITAQDLKAIHRINFRGSAGVGRFSPLAHTWDYFRMVDALVRIKGYRGWVLLFDEAELIGKLGMGARAKAYANISRFLNSQDGLLNTLTIFAFASSFFTDVLDNRNDLAKAPAWLQTRGLAEEAARADRVLDRIAKSESLLPLSQGHLATVMEQIVDAHAGAYGWDPPVDGAELFRCVQELFPARDTKLRTRIRAAIQWLDHLLQYGEPPVLRVSDLMEDKVSGELGEAGRAEQPVRG